MHRSVSLVSRAAAALSPVVLVALVALAGGACSSKSNNAPAVDPQTAQGLTALSAGDWNGALSACTAAEASNPTTSSCPAKYCEMVARSMLVIAEINTFMLPRYRRPLTPEPGDVDNLATTTTLLENATTAAESVATAACEADLPNIPLLIGDKADPVLSGELRGRWTERDAHVLAALFYSIRYGLQAQFNPQAVPPPPDGETTPGLPPFLESMRQHLVAQDQLLFSQPADLATGRGGWLDRNGNGKPDSADELLVDIFKPGTNDRVIDFSDAEFVKGESLPVGSLTPTASLPTPKCQYQKFHIDDVVTGADVIATDGMGFSPDGTKIVVPLQVNGKTHIHTLNTDGTGRTCLTCGQPGNNDGVRWRPGDPDTLVFISDRDHPYATGNAGGGFGQELYAMHADGSQPTRLTTSHQWATNYHVNWSPDGQHIVWGRTEAYAWDVMVADFVSDAQGMRLTNVQRIVHDTTWWETHGFSADSKSIITTNTRAGFQMTDSYAINLATKERTRLTDNPAWDEHTHLSPDGHELSWISGRWNPASVLRLNQGDLSPTNDWLWIIPGIFFEFLNPPAGYTSELTMMDADGSNIRALTSDKKVCADNEWSFDGTRILFRETEPGNQVTRYRILTFDDCQ
jgi:TolB protein